MALSDYSSALAAGDSSDASSPALHEAHSIEEEYDIFDDRDYIANFTQAETATPIVLQETTPMMTRQSPAGGQGAGTFSLLATAPPSGPGVAITPDVMNNAETSIVDLPSCANHPHSIAARTIPIWPARCPNAQDRASPAEDMGPVGFLDFQSGRTGRTCARSRRHQLQCLHAG